MSWFTNLLGKTAPKSTSKNDLAKTTTTQFDLNGVKIIHTSHITAYIENPNGAFQCQNVECDIGLHCIRYLPNPSETIPDIARCPKCGSWMLNDGLRTEWAISNDTIRRASAGTPETYELAKSGLKIFKRFYDASVVVNKINHWKAPVIPSLDVILDIAPRIFDEDMIIETLSLVSTMNLDNYPYDELKAKFCLSAKLKSFFDAIPTNSPQKQTELGKELKIQLPEIQDPTWVFYIWSTFNLVQRTKEKNRVYLERVK